MITNAYDIIIIGSGVGGLTCAALLAKQGQRVLVLEKHYVAGGLTHTYKRGGLEWDSGVHYIGEVHDPSNPFRILFDHISNGNIAWDKMGKEYDRIIFPDREYSFIEGRDNFLESLCSVFSDSKDVQAIKTYLHLLDDVSKAGRLFCQAQALPLWMGSLPNRLLKNSSKRFYSKTTLEVLSKLTNNKKLIGVLTGQYGNYGLPPGKSSFFTHALVARHYLNGGSYPSGGSHRIAETILSTLQASGGEIKLKSTVQNILVDNGKVTGVKLESGEVINSKKVISSVGAHNTYLRLLEPNHINSKLRSSIENTRYSTGYFSLNLAIRNEQASDSQAHPNLWIYPSYDHDYNQQQYFENQSNPLPISYVSFASTKDSSWMQKFPNSESINILGSSSMKWFEKWKDTKSRKQDSEYQDLKSSIAERYLDTLFNYYPNLKSRVISHETSSPITMKKYCNYHHGETYGLEPSPHRFEQQWLRAQSPIKGLYLTGQDVLFAGVCGALMSGAITSLCVNPLGVGRELKRIGFLDATN